MSFRLTDPPATQPPSQQVVGPGLCDGGPGNNRHGGGITTEELQIFRQIVMDDAIATLTRQRTPAALVPEVLRRVSTGTNPAHPGPYGR